MMAELLYKTLGGVSPKGKPRVYFACHGEDFRGCFQEITDEILKISNCAIYYYEEEPDLNEDYYLNLSQMQLIVMPVTSRLLYQPCRAMDVEFPYAVAHHIPVLPLMQEQGLEQRFNEKCGDLQFLDKYHSDSTAIPYAEKLKKYLEAVLIGDALAEKVRAAFDAYVFLSYRKKDRKFAQELMRLLHRDPRCRDIAIWYDEFLTPGENFNDSIREALEKSGLFVLAVTPNLVNEINYVMTTEYPMAREAGKPILPARMQPTDPEALRASYDGIPDSVDPQDEGVLTDAVMAALRDLALRENDADPQHNFFIGLAYLSGIDVEVDHEYAVKLITGAAEAGLTEAMEKLVSMYETGEGVKRDYMTAIAWRERYTKKLKTCYEQTHDEQVGYTYFWQMRELGEAWMRQRQPAKARDVFKTMLDAALEFSRLYGGYYEQMLISVCYAELGDIAREEKKPDEASEWYQKELEIARVMAKSNLPECLDALCCTYEKLGLAAELGGNLHGAKEWHMKALELRERLAEDETPGALQRLVASYTGLGAIAETQRDLKSAKEWYRKALVVSGRLAELGTPRSQQDLGYVYRALGSIERKEGDLTAAGLYYRKSLELLEKHPVADRPDIMRDFSICYLELSRIAQAEGDLGTAKDYLQKWRVIAEKIAAGGAVEAMRDLLVGYCDLGDIAEAESNLDEARKWYRRALNIASRLVELTDSVYSSYDLAYTYHMLGRLDRNADLIEIALSIYRILVAACPEVPDFRECAEIAERAIKQLRENT